jgi:hypothetical protein
MTKSEILKRQVRKQLPGLLAVISNSFEEILEFIVNDIEKKKNPEEWNSMDVVAGIRHWIEIQCPDNSALEEEFNVQGEVKESDFDQEETGDPNNFSDVEIREFKKEWGQTHVEICTNLGYSYSHGQSDELLMEDYFFLETNKEWYPKSSSLYTPREQAISDFLRYKN